MMASYRVLLERADDLLGRTDELLSEVRVMLLEVDACRKSMKLIAIISGVFGGIIAALIATYWAK